MSRSKVRRSPSKIRRQARRAEARAKKQPLREAIEAYRDAIISGAVCILATERGLDLQRVVCERCGLEQEYLNADNFEDDDLDVYPCPGPLDLGCGNEVCISSEHYAELHAPVSPVPA